MEEMVHFSQKAVIIRNNKILLVKTNQEDPTHPNMWELPGGRLDVEENIESNIIREVMEETGLIVSPGRLIDLWSWNMSKSGTRVVAVSRFCKIIRDDKAKDDPSYIGWFSRFEILNMTVIPSQIQTIFKGFG